MTTTNNKDNVYGIYNNSTGIIELTETTININNIQNIKENHGYVYGIYNNNTGIINVTNSIIDCYIDNTEDKKSYLIYNGKGTINIVKSTINNSGESKYGGSSSRDELNTIYNKNGAINITESEINSISNSTSYAINSSGSGTVNILESTINSEGLSYKICGINNLSTGIINISGGIVTSKSRSSGNSFGIENSDTGIVNITQGTISSTSTNSRAYGICNSSTGTITIGTKDDGIISSNEPNIISTYTGTSSSYGGYGVHNRSGTVNFYDGRIEGSTRAVEDESEITEVETIQQPQYSDDFKIYAYGIEATDVARIGDKTYLSLQDAISEATENDVIEILRGIQYTNQDITLTIPTGKNVTIDLQNNPIVSAIEDAVFTVQGNLKIIDTVEGENGKVISSYLHTIYEYFSTKFNRLCYK